MVLQPRDPEYANDNMLLLSLNDEVNILNDEVKVSAADADGWCWASNSLGHQGWIPPLQMANLKEVC